MNSFVHSIFRDVYSGEIRSTEAMKIIHMFCDSKNLNPAINLSVSSLNINDEGREKLKYYEEFIHSINWLVAKLSAKAILIDDAYEDFLDELEILDTNNLDEIFCNCCSEDEKNKCPHCKSNIN